ncbi:sensor histidine kinase [Sulfitobacter faviae]|jgi:PAS domain S-box-containing protein|uniref:sensor histidine kinase n=1 Tax=Sulfitobacter faviae TaxID=1775881 RepID=UPI00398CF9B2
MQNEERSEPRDSDPYQLACLAAGVGVWDWDLRSDEIYFSSLAREIQGLPPDEPATFATVRALTHPDDAAGMLAALERALDPENRSQENYVYRITRPDTGELRWVRAHGVARFAEVEGKIQAVHYSGSLEDITEREEMRRALAESEARLRIALDAAQMAVWEIDLESDIVTSSVELNRLYGFPDDAKPAADDFRARYAPGEGERLAKAGAEARASGENKLQTQVRHVFPDGSERVFLLRAALAPVDHTGRERAIGVVFDITEQARQEERIATVADELRHRLKNLAALMGAIAGRTWARDAHYESFMARLRAMSAATDLMFGKETRAIAVSELVDHVLAPFQDETCKIRIEGSPVPVPNKAISGLAMALHELATNAVKHGALSVPTGGIDVSWQSTADGALELHWKEHGGPPVTKPEHEGFGTQLLRRGALPPPHRVELCYLACGLEAHIHVAGDDPRPEE